MGDLADRFAGHRHRTEDLMVTRVGRKVYLGLAGGGYVRLRAREALELGVTLLRLAKQPSRSPERPVTQASGVIVRRDDLQERDTPSPSAS